MRVGREPLRQFLEGNKTRLRAAPAGLRFAVQTAPWRQPFVPARAKGMGALESVGIRRERLKVEVGPPSTHIYYQEEGGERPALVGAWTWHGGWSLEAGQLEKLAPGVDMGARLQKMSVRPS